VGSLKHNWVNSMEESRKSCNNVASSTASHAISSKLIFCYNRTDLSNIDKQPCCATRFDLWFEMEGGWQSNGCVAIVLASCGQRPSQQSLRRKISKKVDYACWEFIIVLSTVIGYLAPCGLSRLATSRVAGAVALGVELTSCLQCYVLLQHSNLFGANPCVPGTPI